MECFYLPNCFCIFLYFLCAAVGNRSGSPTFYVYHVLRIFEVDMNKEKGKQCFYVRFIRFNISEAKVSFEDKWRSNLHEYRIALGPLEVAMQVNESRYRVLSCLRFWLKMALAHPSSAPLLSSVRWRLVSSCYCSSYTWLIHHPWPERGATERGLIPLCALCSQP